MHPSRIFILVVTGFLWVAGCQSLEQFFQKPDVAFKSVSLQSMSFYDATAIFSFDVTNPNPVGASLRNLTYDLAIDQKSIARGTAEKGLNIPAGGTGVVELPVSITYADVIDSLAELAGKSDIPYDLSGAFNFMGIAIPYHTAGTLPLPKLPAISLKNVQIEKLSWSGAALEFVLELENYNAFGLDVSGLICDIAMGGKPFVHSQTEKGVSISPNGAATVTIPADINFIWLGKSAYDALSGKSTGYAITGEMLFKGPGAIEKRVPFNKSGNVPLLR